MNKHWLCIGILALCTGGCEGVKEVKMPLDELPVAVKTTIQKEAEGGTILDTENTAEEGKTIYEAHAMIGGKPYIIKVAEDGTLLAKKLKYAKNDSSFWHNFGPM